MNLKCVGIVTISGLLLSVPHIQRRSPNSRVPDGAWGKSCAETHGLTPDKLESYLKTRVAEYGKAFKGLAKDTHLQWLKQEIVIIDGRTWADWRFVPIPKGKKEYSHNPVYTRFLATSYKGQLLEISFSSNLNTIPS
jgi:hypothetical protein